MINTYAAFETMIQVLNIVPVFNAFQLSCRDPRYPYSLASVAVSHLSCWAVAWASAQGYPL